MNLQSGVLLPFFLIAIPIVLALVDVLASGNSTSAMTQRHGATMRNRQPGDPMAPRMVP